MKKNVGTIDKVIRIILAALMGILIFVLKLSGPLAIILAVFAVILVLTSLISFCPLYIPFKFSTRKKD
ncbi:MAG: DUF2892 domain-containing protein [Spirochaetales bacterium]|nr:DUF2892 domain-containing protein [Spirochaetales bacterium]